MNARAVAEAPPVISSITPKSQVIKETARIGHYTYAGDTTALLTGHGRHENHAGEEDVSVHAERLVREEELLDDLKIDETTQDMIDGASVPLDRRTTPKAES